MYVSKLKRKIKRKGLLEMSGVILEKKTCIYAESEQQKQIKTINKVNAIFKKALSKLDVAELDTRFIRYILNGLQQTIYSTHILCKKIIRENTTFISFCCNTVFLHTVCNL